MFGLSFFPTLVHVCGLEICLSLQQWDCKQVEPFHMSRYNFPDLTCPASCLSWLHLCLLAARHSQDWGGSAPELSGVVRLVPGRGFAAVLADGTATSFGPCNMGGDCSMVAERLRGVSSFGRMAVWWGSLACMCFGSLCI